MPQVRTVTPNGERIRALRLERGLSAVNLAQKMRCHRQTIHQVERGRTASEALIHQVALALEVPVDEITRENAEAA